jgi:hypothetical protein
MSRRGGVTNQEVSGTFPGFWITSDGIVETITRNDADKDTGSELRARFEITKIEK